MSRDCKVKNCEDDEVESANAATRRDSTTTNTAIATSRSSEAAAGGVRKCSIQEAEEEDDEGSGRGRKRKKRRKTRSKQPPTKLEVTTTTTTTGNGGQQRSHAVLTLASSSDEVEAVGECSKRDSSSSLGGGSRHNTLRESLLTVLGKLVIWKGTRYRSATAASSTSSVPPNSPPATECIGRSTSFFSSGEFPRRDSSAVSSRESAQLARIKVSPNRLTIATRNKSSIKISEDKVNCKLMFCCFFFVFFRITGR